MKAIITVLLLSLIAAGCGGGSSTSSAGGGARTVAFDLDPHAGPVCHGPDRQSSFDGSFSNSINCRWWCADYKQHENAYVSITFEQRNEPGATWVVDREYISDGICS